MPAGIVTSSHLDVASKLRQMRTDDAIPNETTASAVFPIGYVSQSPIVIWEVRVVAKQAWTGATTTQRIHVGAGATANSIVNAYDVGAALTQWSSLSATLATTLVASSPSYHTHGKPVVQPGNAIYVTQNRAAAGGTLGDLFVVISYFHLDDASR